MCLNRNMCLFICIWQSSYWQALPHLFVCVCKGGGGGGGSFSKVVPPLAMWASPFNLFTLEGYCRHSPGGWAGGQAAAKLAETHISVTAWRIFSIRSSVELSRPVGVHCHGHMPICPLWACPWSKNLSNLPQIGSRLCGTHISETAGWIYPI